MGKHSRASTRWLAVLAVTGLLVGACSNSDDDSADTASAATEPAATSPATTQVAVTLPAEISPTTVAGTTPGDVTTAPASTAPVDTTPDIGEFESISGVPGVTDDAINFAVLGTGPSNPLGYCLLDCYAGGVQAYFDWRNSIGGVNGRQLSFDKIDDEMGNTQVRMLELIDSSDVFGVLTAPLIPAGFSDANAARMPVYSTAPSAPAGVGFDNVFTPNTWCTLCLSTTNVFVAKAMGATKVAVIGYGVSPASKDCVNYNKETFDFYGPQVGIEQAYANDELAFGLPNGLGPEVTAMKDAGVDFINTCIDQNGVLTLEQELERQGMGDTVVVLPQGYGDAEYISANADLLEGDVMGTPFRPFEADPGNSNITIMKEFLDKGGYQLNDYFIQGWLNADMAVTGILAAGPQFDRASVIDATNQITDYTAGGLLSPVDFTKWHTDYTPETMASDGPELGCTTLIELHDGNFEMVTPADTPWACTPRTTDTWVDAEFYDFE